MVPFTIKKMTLAGITPMPKGKWFVFLLPMIGFSIITVALGVFAGPVFDYAAAAAQQLMDPQAYIHAVLGGTK